MLAGVLPRIGAMLAQRGVQAIAAGLISGAVVAGAGVATGVIPVGGPRAGATLALLPCPGSGRELTRIASGQTLLVTARSADGSWLQVYVGQPGVDRGWAPAAALRLQADVAGLPVADCSVTALGPPASLTPSPTVEPSPSVEATVLPSPTPSPSPSATPKPTPTPKPHKFFARACGDFDGVAGCTAGGADVFISELIDTNDSGVPDKGDTVKLYRYPTSFGSTAAGWGTFGGSRSIQVSSVTLASDHIVVGGADGRGYTWGLTADNETFGVFASPSPGTPAYFQVFDSFNGSLADLLNAAPGNPLGIPPMSLEQPGGGNDRFLRVVSHFSDSTAPSLSDLKTTGALLGGDPASGYWQIYRPSATCTPHSATISVTATDPDDAVAKVTLYYTPYGSTQELSAPMKKATSTRWQYVLAAQDSWLSGQITYRVTATDTHGNSTDLSYDQELYNLYTSDCP